MSILFAAPGLGLRRESTSFGPRAKSTSLRRTPVSCRKQWNEEDASALHTAAANLCVPPAPHSGSHFVRRRRPPDGIPFFEGWYLRCVLPDLSSSFSFMFSVEANGIATIQVAGLDDKVHFHELEDISGFRASAHHLRMKHWDSDGFGYELSSSGCMGMIPGGISWRIKYSALNTWGDRWAANSRCTATRLSRLRAFEPGWQVLMALGVGNGTILYHNQLYPVDGCRIYIEKNWGSSFPSKWWWVHANAFHRVPDLTITAVGATRMVLKWEETLGMIAIHYRGTLYEFANWNSQVSWQVSWGEWVASAKSRSGYVAKFSASTQENGVFVRGPTQDGMIPNVRDAMHAHLYLSLNAPDGSVLLEQVECCSAQVERGGIHAKSRSHVWKVDVPIMKRFLRGFVNFTDAPSACTTS